MIDAAMLRAIDISLGSGLTSQLVDLKRAVMAIRSATNDADRLVIMELVLDKRATHRTWVTLTQRQWQSHRRTVTPRSCAIRKALWGGKHSDEAILRAERESVDTREKYVRCNYT